APRRPPQRLLPHAGSPDWFDRNSSRTTGNSPELLPDLKNYKRI
ncbi:hypothetical protein A2U01_0108639, partial [Trifolium medium]|nr:hypothetical protein [Trifolium medium]